MAPLIEDSNNATSTTGTLVVADRPRHATQPDGKLIPATMEIDEEGNPIFYYPESTPQKLSPLIVAPRSILDRLSMKRASVTVHTTFQPKRNNKNANNNKPGIASAAEQPLQQHQNRIVSLHHSLSEDEKLEIYQDDDDDENQSIRSKGNSIAGSVSSLTKLKLGLRRHRKKKDIKQQDSGTPIMITLLKDKHQNKRSGHEERSNSNNKKKQHHNYLRMNFGRHSGSGSHTESTQSVSSQASSSVVDGENSEASSDSSSDSLQALEPSGQQPEVEPAKEKKTKDPEPRGNSEASPSPFASDAPPPLATLKTAMESAGMTYSGHNDNSRRASAPTLLVQKPKTKNHVSVVKASANATRPPVISTAAADQPSIDSKHSARSRRPSSTKSSTSAAYSGSNHPENANFKIYLLLLHPTSKIFELIQLFFNPTTTTIRDVLNMISTNASEPALGAQDYTSLCRPNSDDEDDEEITDLDLLVQNHDNMKYSAQVIQGETLAAIPVGYTARKIATLSRQILVNPRICRLMERQDPLTPQKLKKRTVRNKESGSRRRSGASSLPRKNIEVLVKHDEDNPTHVEEGETSMLAVQRAMKKAASAAAAANAAVHELQLPKHKGKSLVAAVGKKYRYPNGRNVGESAHRGVPCSPGTDASVSIESVLKSMDSSVGTKMDYSCADASECSNSLRSYQYSVDESFSTWSKSLDTSFAGGSLVCAFSKTDTPVSALSTATTPKASTKSNAAIRRRNRNMRLMRQVAAGVVTVMFVTYFVDSNGFSTRHVRINSFRQLPLRVTGMGHLVCFFLVLAKLQFLCTIPHPQANCLKRNSKCPLMKVRAALLAADTQSNPRASHSFGL